MSFKVYDQKHKPYHKNRQSRNYNNGRDAPPVEIPEEFKSTPQSLKRTHDKIEQQRNERRISQKINEAVQNEQYKSTYGYKRVTLDDDDEDEHAPAMATNSSMLDPPPIPPPSQEEIVFVVSEKSNKKKHKKEKKHKKKHKRCSSEEEDIDGDWQGTSVNAAAKHGSPMKHKKHKKHKRRSSSKSADEIEEGTSSSMAKRQKRYANDVNLTDDTLQSDLSFGFLTMDEKIVPKTPPQIESQIQGHAEDFAINKQPLFNQKNMANLDVNATEQISQQQKSKADESEGFIPLCGDGDKMADEGTSKEIDFELDDEKCNAMDADAFKYFFENQSKSCQETLTIGTIEEQYSLLKSKVIMNEKNVKAWIEFIDFHRPYYAYKEWGYAEAQISDKKAYFKEVMQVMHKAIGANPDNGELAIKRLQIMQDYYGVDSRQMINEWEKLEEHFINNIQMWEGNLKMRINDNSVFKLDQAIKKIDDCMETLVKLKYRKSHCYLEGTDEFLIKLLVTRCRLFIATGHLHKAIGMFQALAEFHCLRPIHLLGESKLNKLDQLELAKVEFKRFWESGNQRIGEGEAEGWMQIQEDQYGYEEDFKQHEHEELERYKIEIDKKESTEIGQYNDECISAMEARCRFEEFRSKHNWMPIHFDHGNKDLYNNRFVGFNDIAHVLFPMENDSLIQELLFKLFHIFGIPIPGFEQINSQEDTLRKFSADLFPSMRPNSMGLEGFDEFFTSFIQFLAESPRMDSARIYSALATKISSNSSLSKYGKIEKLEKLKNSVLTVNEDESLKRWHLLGPDQSPELPKECKLSILITSLEELAKLGKVHFKDSIKILYEHLDRKRMSIWNIGNGNAEQIRERLILLLFILYIVRNLPFSDEEGAKFGNIGKKNDKQKFTLKTKREFLLSLWANGTISEIDKKHENVAIEKAQKRVLAFLSRRAPPTNLQCLWIGNEAEILFELAALFCYELPFQSNLQRYKFFNNDDPLFTSNFANSMNDDKSLAFLQQIRANVLQHIIRVTNGSEYTWGELVKFLRQKVEMFPRSISLFKMFIDININKGSGEQILMLAKIPENDVFTRFIRNCAQIYIQQMRLKMNKNNAEQEQKRNILHFVEICTEIAKNNSDNLIPDDYIWALLVQFLMNQARSSIPIKNIMEIFKNAQKVCPWSRELLFRATKNRPQSESHFLKKLYELISKHGIIHYTIDNEVEEFMTASS